MQDILVAGILPPLCHMFHLGEETWTQWKMQPIQKEEALESMLVAS